MSIRDMTWASNLLVHGEVNTFSVSLCKCMCQIGFLDVQVVLLRAGLQHDLHSFGAVVAILDLLGPYGLL